MICADIRAISVDGSTIQTYGWWSGKTTGTFTVKGGKYYGADGKAVDESSMKGKSFRIDSGGS
jgi:hypothetical protein